MEEKRGYATTARHFCRRSPDLLGVGRGAARAWASLTSGLLSFSSWLLISSLYIYISWFSFWRWLHYPDFLLVDFSLIDEYFLRSKKDLRYGKKYIRESRRILIKLNLRDSIFSVYLYSCVYRWTCALCYHLEVFRGKNRLTLARVKRVHDSWKLEVYIFAVSFRAVGRREKAIDSRSEWQTTGSGSLAP